MKAKHLVTILTIPMYHADLSLLAIACKMMNLLKLNINFSCRSIFTEHIYRTYHNMNLFYFNFI